jgi:PTS system beta-glucosides-specific IIC component
MKYEKLNKAIIELVGGKENVVAAAHCVTRLRLTLNNRDLAKTEEIKELDGVIDVVSNDVAYQVIIGTHVTEVYNEFMSLTGLGGGNEATSEKEKLSWKKIPTAVLSVVSESMTSIIEVLIAAGMIAGILSLLSLTGIVSAESPTYQIFQTLQTSIFTFLPIFFAFSSARRLNVNPYVATVLATTVMSSNITGAKGLSLFGYQLSVIDYSHTFIPILLAIALLKFVTTQLEKVVPKAIQLFFVPAVSLMIVLPVLLTVFGPVGMWIGSGISWVFTLLSENIGYWIVVMLYAAFQPFLIVLGAANFLFPIGLTFFADLGYDPVITGAATISDIAVAGAMIGYFLKTKKEKEKATFGTIGFSAVMGITEPAIFGVFLKYRRPFIAVIVGGGIGGLIAGLAGVKAWTMAWGLAGLPAFLIGGTGNFIWMIISCVTAFLLAGAVTYGLGIPQEEKDVKKEKIPTKAGQIALENVSSGEVIQLSQVSDSAFASGALGKGFAVIPDEGNGEVFAPISGEVTVVFPTKHAYGIKTEEGVEVLIHVGVDTVNLEGKGFTSYVKVGDQVKTGDILATVDFSTIQAAGFDTTVMVVVTNSADFLDVVPLADDSTNQVLAVII